MWAQSWEAIEELVRPYPDKEGVDVTEEMQNQVSLKKLIFHIYCL